MINIKTKKEIKMLKKGGKILSSILDKIEKEIKPEVNTKRLEEIACKLIEKAGGRPAFKNYEIFSGEYYPTALCTSVNEEVVHAPSLPGRVLKEGDIIGIDLGMEYPVLKDKKFKIRNKHSRFGGFYTDMARTIGVGKIDKKSKELIKVTKKSLELAIKIAIPGKTLKDIGKTIQKYVESHDFSVVRDLVGHGVGYDVHEEPQVFNYDFSKSSVENIELVPGMVIAIEPMVNMGGFEIKTGDNNFSVETVDGKLSAHFEHTIAITKKGNIIITE